MTEAQLERKNQVTNRISSGHNPRDVAAISVLAAAVLYLLSRDVSSILNVVPAFFGTVVLIAVVVWLLGLFYRQEAEIDFVKLQALEVANRSETRGRQLTADEVDFLER